MATTALAAALALAVVAAGCGHGGSPADRAGADGTATTAAGAGTSTGKAAAPPATGPAAPATPAPAKQPTPAPARAGTPVSFAGTTFTVPAGWKVHARGNQSWDSYGAGDNGTEHHYQRLCLRPATGAAARGDEFCGLTVMAGDVPGNENQRAWNDDDFWPWSSATDVTPCPTAGGNAASQDYIEPADGGKAGVRGFAPVGSHTAVYRQWKVDCMQSGFTFTPRSWHLPKSKIVFVDTLGQAETPAILASVHFGS